MTSIEKLTVSSASQSGLSGPCFGKFARHSCELSETWRVSVARFSRVGV